MGQVPHLPQHRPLRGDEVGDAGAGEGEHGGEFGVGAGAIHLL